MHLGQKNCFYIVLYIAKNANFRKDWQIKYNIFGKAIKEEPNLLYYTCSKCTTKPLFDA